MHIVYKLLVCIVPYSCMLTQLYNDLLGVKLVNPNENLLHTLDTWQIFGTRRSYTCLPQCYFSIRLVITYAVSMYTVSRKYIIVIHKIHVADVISCIYYLVIVTILRYGICIFFGVILLCYLCVIF